MVQAWGRTIQALHDAIVLRDIAVLRAGAVPTREEISTWYAQFSLARFWQDGLASLYQIPHGARLSAGVVLAALGIVLIWKSYRRATRPSQADVIRRISQVSHTDSRHDVPENTRLGPSLDEVPPVGMAPVQPAPPSPPLRPQTPQAFLTADQFTEGPAPWAVPLRQDLLRIGRHQENDIRLEDKTVHRYHALLHRSPDGDFLIRDLSGHAGNGVYVNGARIEQTALRPGDLVELGAVRLRFQQQRPS